MIESIVETLINFEKTIPLISCLGHALSHVGIISIRVTNIFNSIVITNLGLHIAVVFGGKLALIFLGLTRVFLALLNIAIICCQALHHSLSIGLNVLYSKFFSCLFSLKCIHNF